MLISTYDSPEHLHTANSACFDVQSVLQDMLVEAQQPVPSLAECLQC